MNFSERFGHKKVQDVLQLNDMNSNLKIALWNCLIKWEGDLRKQTGEYGSGSGFSILQIVYKDLWSRFLHLPLDKCPILQDDIRPKLNKAYFESEWFQVYDYVELYFNSLPQRYSSWLTQEINYVLEQENSGYRMESGHFIPITSNELIDSICKATKTEFNEVNNHIQKAINLLSHRENPDYRNVIKESVSAIETLANIILETAKRPLSANTDRLKEKLDLHTNLKEAIKKFYDYASDVARHGEDEKNPSNIEKSDAIMALVICSGYINYLIARLKK